MPSDNGFQAGTPDTDATAGPRGVSDSVIGSDAPPTLTAGTRQLLHDIARLVDRGLEYAEAVLHERRQDDERIGYHDERTYHALEAIAHVRDLARRGA